MYQEMLCGSHRLRHVIPVAPFPRLPQLLISHIMFLRQCINIAPRASVVSRSPTVYTLSLTNPARKIKTMAPHHQTSQKTYHTKATGNAAFTQFNHKDESDLKLFGSCFW